MSTQSLLESIQGSALANWMRYTNGAMPVVESVHVLAAALLFGTVLIVDLRLLALADAWRTYTRVSRETLRLTWLAFVVSVITGSLMFTTSPQTYFYNVAFQWKALALVGAGLNMALFQLVTARGIAVWSEKQHAAAHRARRGLASSVRSGRPWCCSAAGSASPRATTSRSDRRRAGSPG